MSLFRKSKDINLGLEKAGKTPGSMVIDVRTYDEYRQGHVPGSINIPMSQISDPDLDEGTPLFVYCLSGARAGRACDVLNAMGFNAENIGGINRYKGELSTDR